MPLIEYTPKRFTDPHMQVIDQANAIIEEYAADGLALTLRQLYYRFVAAALIPNNQNSYNRLGSIINAARLAGVVDWEAIEDRGRGLIGNPSWSNPGGIIRASANSYHLDHWEGQDHRVEVWVEKQALEGVVGQACQPLDVDFFSCKGYMSQSEMWRAAERFDRYTDDGQHVVMIHLGDHDPSGIDMTRDIDERTNDVFGARCIVKRIALNMDQIEEFNPPPNAAKVTDSRSTGYIDKYGMSSWELDALEPSYMRDIIRDEVWSWCDRDLWDAIEERQENERKVLKAAARRWDDVAEYLENGAS